MKKASISKSAKKKIDNAEKIQEYTIEIKAIQRYRNRINIIEEGKETLQSGKGYTQPKRNAYKINQTTGKYGNLTIDLPKLFGQLKMIAYINGKKIYDKDVDFDTIDLFTKRFNGRKRYSDLSKKVFNDINKLSEIPIHKSSKKYKKIGSGVVYYNNPQDLLSRLELLGGSILSGNNGVKNEFSEIAHVLKKYKYSF